MKLGSSGRCPRETTFIKAQKEALGHKPWKDRLTPVLCGNTAGHVIKPGISVQSKEPICSQKQKLSAHDLET